MAGPRDGPAAVPVRFDESAQVMLRPPADPPADTHDRSGGWWLALVLVVTIAVAAGVAFLLPDFVGRQAGSAASSDTAAQPVVAGADRGAVTVPDAPDTENAPETRVAQPRGALPYDTVREQAAASLQRYLRTQAQPGLDRVDIWGGASWQAAASSADDGERLLRESRFEEATAAYDYATRAAEALVAGRPVRFAELLSSGSKALEAGDVQAAIDAYHKALAMEPESPEGVRGLARSRVRSGVLRHMQAGQEHETARDLSAAVDEYRSALRLDPEYGPARAAEEQVRDRLEDGEFQRAMNRALAGIKTGDLAAADTALESARALRPDHAAVRDAARRLVAARRHAQLARLRQRAQSRIAAEDWEGAATAYEAALAVDADTAFARDGLTLAQQRIEWHRLLDHYLAGPDRLASAQPFANAERLLATIRTAGGHEPRLASKLQLLRSEVERYRTPVTVTLRSDGNTEVTIYHVGTLGRFHETQVELRPGRYTITGARTGYRDARVVIDVVPGAAAAATIRCEEPI